MKKLIVLCLFLTAGLFDSCFDFGLAHAANTFSISESKCVGNACYTKYEGSFDATGVLCVPVIPYTRHTIFVDAGGGTQTYDIESANTVTNPNETGQSTDLPSSSNLTADGQFEGELAIANLCLRIDACSSCDITVTGWSVD